MSETIPLYNSNINLSPSDYLVTTIETNKHWKFDEFNIGNEICVSNIQKPEISIFGKWNPPFWYYYEGYIITPSPAIYSYDSKIVTIRSLLSNIDLNKFLPKITKIFYKNKVYVIQEIIFVSLRTIIVRLDIEVFFDLVSSNTALSGTYYNNSFGNFIGISTGTFSGNLNGYFSGKSIISGSCLVSGNYSGTFNAHSSGNMIVSGVGSIIGIASGNLSGSFGSRFTGTFNGFVQDAYVYNRLDLGLGYHRIQNETYSFRGWSYGAMTGNYSGNFDGYGTGNLTSTFIGTSNIVGSCSGNFNNITGSIKGVLTGSSQGICSINGAGSISGTYSGSILGVMIGVFYGITGSIFGVFYKDDISNSHITYNKNNFSTNGYISELNYASVMHNLNLLYCNTSSVFGGSLFNGFSDSFEDELQLIEIDNNVIGNGILQNSINIQGNNRRLIDDGYGLIFDADNTSDTYLNFYYYTGTYTGNLDSGTLYGTLDGIFTGTFIGTSTLSGSYSGNYEGIIDGKFSGMMAGKINGQQLTGGGLENLKVFCIEFDDIDNKNIIPSESSNMLSFKYTKEDQNNSNFINKLNVGSIIKIYSGNYIFERKIIYINTNLYYIIVDDIVSIDEYGSSFEVKKINNVGWVLYDNGLIVLNKSYFSSSILDEAPGSLDDNYNDFLITFRSKYKIYENQLLCTIKETEANYTTNYTAYNEGYILDENGVPSGSLKENLVNDEFAPYITTICLYSKKKIDNTWTGNRDNCYTGSDGLIYKDILAAVGRLNSPIQTVNFTDTTFVLRWDS